MSESSPRTSEGKGNGEDSEPLAQKGGPERSACWRACCFILCCCRHGQSAQYHDTQRLDIHLKNSKRDRVAYLADRVLAKRWRFFLALTAWGLIQVLIGGLAYALVYRYDPVEEGGSERRPQDDITTVIEGIWVAWTFMADPGTHAHVFDTDQRIVGSFITIGGILFFASILGLTVDIIREKMDSLRQGKSKIIEKDHTLILGWTEKTIHIIEELCSANESEGGGVVAVLAPFPKEQMESELEFQLPSRVRRGTRVVFRSGSPLLMGDLIRVSVHMARAIIILASSGDADQADSDTLRTMLSLRSLLDDLRGHVVAEVRDIDNEPLVKLVGGHFVETLVSHDVIGRLMLMSVRQPGLAKVYEALLGFDGDEFYMEEWPELVGVEFGELMERFPDAIPIGVHKSSGVVTLRPSWSYVISPGDKIIVIAEDNDTYKPEPPSNIDAGEPPEDIAMPQETEKILFCGWRRDIRDVLQQLDNIVKSGTDVHMMTHCVPIHLRNDRLLEDGLDVKELRNLRLIHHFGNTSVRRKIEVLPIAKFTSCMIFADQAFESDTLHADSHSLATLLLIRDIQSKHLPVPAGKGMLRTLTDLNPAERCPIVCEVLDPHTQKTIAGNKHLSLTSDFCQTNKLVAQVLSMIAEERVVNLIFDELLGQSGCNIAVVPSSRYVNEGEMVSFMILAKRAARYDELLIGYQKRESIEKTLLNPAQKHKLCRWHNYDFAILRGEMKVTQASQGIPAEQSFANLEQRACKREGLRDRIHKSSSTLSMASTTAAAPDEAAGAGATVARVDNETACVPRLVIEECKVARAVLRELPLNGMQGEKLRTAVDVLANAVDSLRQIVYSISGRPETETPYNDSNRRVGMWPFTDEHPGNGVRPSIFDVPRPTCPRQPKDAEEPPSPPGPAADSESSTSL